nr:glutamine synthetase cytosolic isozyme 1-1-like [Coffea arabica]
MGMFKHALQIVTNIWFPLLLFEEPCKIGGSNMYVRSKARTLAGPVNDPAKLPMWNYDCPAGEPILTNEKQNAAKIFSSSEAYLAVLKLLPRNLGMESSKSTPCCRRKLTGLLDGQSEGILDRRAGADKAYHDIVDSHYKASLYAGMESSKSTPCCRRKLNGLLDGQSEGILDRRCCAFVSFDVH